MELSMLVLGLASMIWGFSKKPGKSFFVFSILTCVVYLNSFFTAKVVLWTSNYLLNFDAYLVRAFFALILGLLLYFIGKGIGKVIANFLNILELGVLSNLLSIIFAVSMFILFINGVYLFHVHFCGDFGIDEDFISVIIKRSSLLKILFFSLI